MDTTATLQALESSFNISVWNLLPVLVLMLLGLRKYPAFLSILIGTLVGALVAVVMQPEVVAAFANDTSQRINQGWCHWRRMPLPGAA